MDDIFAFKGLIKCLILIILQVTFAEKSQLKTINFQVKNINILSILDQTKLLSKPLWIFARNYDYSTFKWEKKTTRIPPVLSDQDAMREGGKIEFGGNLMDREGNYVEPTIISGLNHDSPVVHR